MRVEVDQSGKVEQTNIITVLGYSNKTSDSISISAVEKVKLQKWFKKFNNPRLFIIKTFCALLYMLIKDYLKKEQDIFIDREYPGYDNLIKNQIKVYANANNQSINSHYLHLTFIGRHSSAHKVAVIAHRKKKSNQKITAKEIIELIKKSGNT